MGIRFAAILGLLGFLAVPAHAHFHWPNSGRVSSNYYSSRPYGYHRAIDIAGPSGQVITAAYSGRVSFRGWSGGYGNLVILSHVNGYTTYYAHNRGFAVSSGQSVRRDQTIAYEGSTGNSTGPHCHFEIRRYGTKLYIPASVGSYKTKRTEIPYQYAPGM
jgi:murein DD-endopeptidase MepM/ murein hydrolase activator NlpD